MIPIVVLSLLGVQLLLNEVAIVARADIPGKRRTIKLGLFFSKQLMDRWTQEKQKTPSDLTNYLKTTFLKEYNALWDEKQWGNYGIDINFEFTHVQYVTAAEQQTMVNRKLELIQQGNNVVYTGLKSFCEWAKPKNKGKWNVPVYFVDGLHETNFTANTPGRAYYVGGICQPENCALIQGRIVNWRFEPMLNSLLAHEVGHIFGFNHPPQGCLKDIMWSPGSYSVWSNCTQSKANEILSNPWAYPCLDYQQGTMAPPTKQPGMISDEDKAVLGTNCKGELQSHNTYKDGRYYYMNNYLALFKESPDWWHVDNVCKWIPCRVPYNGVVLFTAITALEGKPCGVNKVCKNQVCV